MLWSAIRRSSLKFVLFRQKIFVTVSALSAFSAGLLIPPIDSL